MGFSFLVDISCSSSQFLLFCDFLPPAARLHFWFCWIWDCKFSAECTWGMLIPFITPVIKLLQYDHCHKSLFHSITCTTTFHNYSLPNTCHMSNKGWHVFLNGRFNYNVIPYFCLSLICATECFFSFQNLTMILIGDLAFTLILWRYNWNSGNTS